MEHLTCSQNLIHFRVGSFHRYSPGLSASQGTGAATAASLAEPGPCAAAYLFRPSGDIERTALFDPAQHLQQFGRIDLRNGPLADIGEDVQLQSEHDLAGIVLAPAFLLVLVPFERHGLEGVFGVADGLRLAPAACPFLSRLLADNHECK